MYVFLAVYLTIYGGAHLYLLRRTLKAFELGAPFPAFFLMLGLFMVGAPMLVRILERIQLEAPARVIAEIGYSWMGCFFLFLSASLALDLFGLILKAVGQMLQRDLSFSEPGLVAASLCIALAASIYGLFEARHVKVEQVVLESTKLPAGVGRLRIVQVSDVHLGLMVGRPRLEQILAQVAALKPDLLVSTGDLVDGQMDGLKGLDTVLATVRAPLGNFAVLGNHEVFAGVGPSVAFTTRGGYRMLRGEAVAVNSYLTVAGVDDPAVRYRQKEKGSAVSEKEMLEKVPQDHFTLLLKHRPAIDPGAQGKFDLQLSGHVHKGQIFPFNLITHLAYPAKMGLSRFGTSWLYVSRGTGTWGPPIRVLAPPEVTVIDVVQRVMGNEQ
ncbi:metallophosphoesterase [Geomesophilobacter sediminis]|uniref:Metallophosphoesterase n=1 Tax=Geomesophilobacter sediminis TaxID=2798584 RepID=A0A8J7J0A7_9BACT|nr:metallophosphoesterase [Geomesophilobacter sediminis]MBJ6725972.1 metallophosphoesterase [Geomesophilobacter sediminis]